MFILTLTKTTMNYVFYPKVALGNYNILFMDKIFYYYVFGFDYLIWFLIFCILLLILHYILQCYL